MAAATTTTPDASPAGLARWTPSLPSSLLNMINPFATPTPHGSANGDDRPSATSSSSTNPSHVETHRSAPPAVLRRPVLSAVQLHQATPQASDVSSRSNSSVMFAEPDARSSDAGSREGSVDGRRAKKTARPKTQFSICHPPPESKALLQKLHRRPRSLLQLHRLSTNARPRPALEVIPSANFSVRLTRAITRVFKAKHSLCPSDLVVLKAEKYSVDEAADDEEDQEARDVIGIICKGRINCEDKQAGKIRIFTATGAEWEACAAVNGGYEFCSTDEHGLVTMVRWWPKRKKESGKSATKEGKRRFNFSTISPNSRRHPVIASLSCTGLDVNDSYKIPEQNAGTPLRSPMPNAGFDDDDDDANAEDEPVESDQMETDDRLREIISLTAIFVAFREGWSPSFRFDDKDKDSTSPAKSGSTPMNSPPASPVPFPLEKRSSIKSLGSGIIRRTSVLSRSNRSSINSLLELEEPADQAIRSNSLSKPSRSRADSSSTVLVHRAASNRRKHNNSTSTWRPDMLPADEPLEETSRESLSRECSMRIQSPSPLARNDGDKDEHNETVANRSVPDRGTGSGATSPDRRSRKTIERLEVLKGHRESATTYASTSSSPVTKTVPPRMARKGRRSGWRRVLMCGSSSSTD